MSERGNVLAGSGWVPLRDGLSVHAALHDFASLAARRWTHVELYKCRSFVSELAALLAADATLHATSLDADGSTALHTAAHLSKKRATCLALLHNSQHHT